MPEQRDAWGSRTQAGVQAQGLGHCSWLCAEQGAGPPGVCACFGLAGALMSAKGIVNIVRKLLQKESVSMDVSIKLFGSFLYN